ncbi:MAG: glycosyltransferase [Candidatus Zipacnadales bacterium]
MAISNSQTPELRIAYILNQFPSVSETFVLREMTQLEKQGLGIWPCALLPIHENDPIHRDAEPFLNRVVYRPPPGSAQSLTSWLAYCVRHPKGGVSSAVFALTHALRWPNCMREMASSLTAAGHFARVVDELGIQHIHAQFGSRPATVGMLLAEMTGLSYSLSLHARDLFTSESTLLTQKLREAEFATVCTRFAYDRLIATQPAAVHGRIHLVRHGLNLTRFSMRHQPSPQPIIAVIGRLVEKKGHKVLLRALQLLRYQQGQLLVAIAGDGPLWDDLENMAEMLGVSRLVTFCGMLTEDEVQELLTRSRALVVPSVVAADGDRDGLPNVILEAAAIGTPIIASNISAIPEFVEHGKTGLLVPPDEPKPLADAISAILQDPVGASRLAHEARKRVMAEYDIHRNALALEALFRETIARRYDGGEAARRSRSRNRRPASATPAQRSDR